MLLKNFLRRLTSCKVEYWLTSVEKDGVEYAVLVYRVLGHPDGFAIMRNGNRAFSPEEVMEKHRECFVNGRLDLARLGYVRIYKDTWDEWRLEENLEITPPKGRPSYIVCLRTREVYPEFYGSRYSTRICKRGRSELGEWKLHYLSRLADSSRLRFWYCLGDAAFFTDPRSSVLDAAERLTAML